MTSLNSLTFLPPPVPKIRQLKTPRLADSQIKIKTADYQEICRRFDEEGISDGQGLRIFFETYFTPYLVQGNGNADGKFTSYYEAEIRASRQRHGKYRYPVYGKPHDLIEINLRDFDPDLPDTRLVGRVSGQKMLPYYTRADIEKAPFNAPVLLWGDSAVDIHIMQIQGSAIARLDDGSQVRIGYADNNGRRFKGIGSILLGKGLLEAGKADMMSIKKMAGRKSATGCRNYAGKRTLYFSPSYDNTGTGGGFRHSVDGRSKPGGRPPLHSARRRIVAQYHNPRPPAA